MIEDLAGRFFAWLYLSIGRLKCKLRRKHKTIYIKADKKHICLDCDYEKG
jgi:ribosomal protein L37AE/L43A